MSTNELTPGRDHLLACLALSGAELAPRAWRLLVERFGSPEGVLDASDTELAAIKGISAQVRTRIVTARDHHEKAEAVLARLEEIGATAVPFDSPDYPPLLKQIPDPPGLLYVRGQLTEADRFSIAIVGSRHPRPYGLQMSRKLGEDLARGGLTVVSGGARGIDSAAHEGALASGGRTIAVLGCGVDISYPAENRDLFTRIASQGAVVSEFPPGAPPESWRFPRRNRIISGISRGVIVCDATEDSGSLITATCAAEHNRDVFAVPGNVDSGHNKGAHRLLKEGAKLVENAEDVFAELGMEPGPGPAPSPVPVPEISVSSEERRVLELLDLEPLPLDDIIEKAGMPASDVAGALTFLEMKRLIKRVAGPAYIRVLR